METYTIIPGNKNDPELSGRFPGGVNNPGVPGHFQDGSIDDTARSPEVDRILNSETSMRIFFKCLDNLFKPKNRADPERGWYYTQGDADGFTFGYPYGDYEVTIQRRYAWNALYHNTAEWFEVVGVTDQQGDEYPEMRSKLNNYAQENLYR